MEGELINKILDLPLTDMEGHVLKMECNSNGKGPMWTVKYTRTSPAGVEGNGTDEKIIEFNDDFENVEMRGLEGLLQQLLDILNLKDK